MSKLDRLKEEVAYFKYWQGIMVVTDISLGGWLISAGDSAAPWTFAMALVAGILLTIAIVVLHRQIVRRIDQIEKL